MQNQKNSLGLVADIRKSLVGANFCVALAPGGSSLRQECEAEIGQYINKDNRTVYERYLGLTADMGKIIQLGETLPLLFILIRKCGGGDSCIENYGILSEECRVSGSTIKCWGNKLEQMGFINKEISGPNGLKFTLKDEAIGRSDLFQKIDGQLSQAAEQIQATMVVAQNAFKQALASILFKTGEN